MRPILEHLFPRELLLTEYVKGMNDAHDMGCVEKNVTKCLNCHYMALISVVNSYDATTGTHLKSAEKISAHIAYKMGLPLGDVISVTLGAVLHDIGKIGIDHNIITKPGALTLQERTEVEKHSEIGMRILSSLCTPWELSDYAYMHHERLDGTGYPRKLTADQIPLTVRILSVADVIDAMSADRPYRKGMPLNDVFDFLYDRCSQFDVDVIRAAETYCYDIYKTIE